MMAPEPPPPVAPPKGLAGILEGSLDYDGGVLDTSNFPPNMVLLNVYDVSSSDLLQKINRVTTANNRVLVGGVFHAGVEVYGEEWCYGATEEDRSGVCAVRPRCHPQHTYRATVPMGPTDLNTDQVDDLVERLAEEWPGRQYDLIHNNCLSFCNALLKELGLRRIPGWIDRAARAASFIDNTSKKLSADTRTTVAQLRTFGSELENNVRNLQLPVGDEETIDTLRRESSKALEVARAGSSQLATLAQAQVEVAQGQVQAVARELSGAAALLQQWVGETATQGAATPLAGQELGDAIRSRALDFREKTQALGSGLWEAASPLADTIAQAVAATPMGVGPTLAAGGARDVGNNRAGSRHVSDVESRGTVGMIRRQEDSLLSESLLHGMDDSRHGFAREDDFNPDAIVSGSFSRAPPPESLLQQLPTAGAIPSPAAPQPAVASLANDAGAGMDFLTGDEPCATRAIEPKASPGTFDLLTGD